VPTAASDQTENLTVKHVTRYVTPPVRVDPLAKFKKAV
jgi:hypothetical protein